MPAVSTGVVYLLAVLLVSTYWGLWLGLTTAVASAAVFDLFHIPPTDRFTIEDAEHWVALAVFFAAAVVTSTLAEAARALAAPGRRAIHVLVTITVPANAPIDAVMPEAEAKAQAAIDSARLRGKRRVSGHFEKVRAGEAGRRIVLEAKEIKAAVVVMALPARRTGSSVFGRTLETVLSERPCRVIIDSSRDVQERAQASP